MNESVYARQIFEVLKDMGVGPNLKGYHYVSSIALNMLNGKFSMSDKQMYIYKITAKQFNTTPSRLERAIRHLVECAFDVMPQDVIEKYFGNSVSFKSGKVVNSQFIASIVQYIKVYSTNEWVQTEFKINNL